MFYIISLFAAELEEPKIVMWGKGLIIQSKSVPIKYHDTISYPSSDIAIHFYGDPQLYNAAKLNF